MLTKSLIIVFTLFILLTFAGGVLAESGSPAIPLQDTTMQIAAASEKDEESMEKSKEGDSQKEKKKMKKGKKGKKAKKAKKEEPKKPADE